MRQTLLCIVVLTSIACSPRAEDPIACHVAVRPDDLAALRAVLAADRAPRGRITITNWFHPIDRVVAVIELPRRDIDDRTAVTPRIAYVDRGSSRTGNEFTTTGRWVRLSGRFDLAFDRFVTAGTVRYLYHGADYDRVARVLARLAAGAVDSGEIGPPRITIDQVDRVTGSAADGGITIEVWNGSSFDCYVEDGGRLRYTGFGEARA